MSCTLNLEVCVKIFLRMVRCYRESYYLIEHSSDNIKLVKSVNSTQILQDIKVVEDQTESFGATSWMRRIRIPEALAQQFFESNVANTIIASIVEFFVIKGSADFKNGS